MSCVMSRRIVLWLGILMGLVEHKVCPTECADERDIVMEEKCEQKNKEERVMSRVVVKKVVTDTEVLNSLLRVWSDSLEAMGVTCENCKCGPTGCSELCVMFNRLEMKRDEEQEER